MKVTETDNDDNLSLPSTSSSAVQTPEATTPTKPDGSPIMRGLKSVLNLFRSSHSPVPPEDVTNDEHQPTQEEQPSEPQPGSCTPCHDLTATKDSQSNLLHASTPISNTKLKDSSDSLKRNSPLKDSLVFNQDLERELQWQDETEVFFKHEKIPIHKLLFPSGQSNVDVNTKLSDQHSDRNKLDSTVEHMDISNVDVSYKSVIEDKTLNDSKVTNNDLGVESDNDYLDCETTYTNKSHILETEQEVKSSQVVFQIDTIPHETCFVEYIDSINKPDNVNDNQNKESVSEETIKKTSTVAIETLSHVDELKSPAVTEIDTLDNSSRPLQNNSTVKTPEITDTFELDIHSVNNANNNNVTNIVDSDAHTQHSFTEIESKIYESINQAEAIKNDISLEKYFENEKLSSVTDNPQIEIEDPITTNQSFIQESANVYPSCVETSNIKKSTEFEIEILSNLQNLATNNEVMKTESAINIDDENTTRILFDINAILNHEKSNYNKDEISNSVLNTIENDSSHEVTDINDIIVMTSTENIKDNVVDSVEVDKVSAIIDELNDKTLVFNDNVLRVDDNRVMDTTVCKTTDLQNINLTKTSDTSSSLNMNVDNVLNEPDVNNEITKTECDSKDGFCNPNFTVECTNNDFKLNDEPQDVTMDSLEYNVNITDHTHTRIKTVSSNDEFKCGTELLGNTTLEQKHDFPLPFDVPLPSDDNFEKECSLDHNVDITSEIITDKTSYDNNNLFSNKHVDQADVCKTTVELNEQAAYSNVSEKNQIKSDIQMSTDFSNSIQEITSSQLSTNLTTCLQEMNVGTDIIESLTVAEADKLCCLNDTTTDINQQMNVDVSTEITFPNVVQAIEEIKTTTISNEGIHLEDKSSAKMIDEEIVISANNSPYVSVTELDFNLITNKPVVEPENPTESEISVSHPISPQLPKRGYNINFDEIENPFATKTNMRMSPLPGEEVNKTFDPVSDIKENTDVQRKPPNRRMSQPEGKKLDINKKHYNTSINRVKITNSKAKQSSNKEVKTKNTKEVTKEQDDKKCKSNNLASNEEYLKTYNSMPSVEHYYNTTPTTTVTEISGDPENEPGSTEADKTNTFNEQNYNNTFGSADQNLNDNKPDPKNVFNIPEIDDMNFNPFATKSRICVTPPPIEHKNIENITANINTTVCIEDNFQDETKIMSNTINITSSSINTDKDVTVRECNTEDDDTVEGPFFEAEELVDVVKVPEIEENKDAMQFNDLPLSSNNEDMDKGEFFIDAEAFEFLLNQNKSNVVVDSGKESLFLKFDPLFAKRVSSDGVLAALTSIQKKQSTPKKLTKPMVDLAREVTPTAPVPGPSNVSSVAEQLNEVAVSKPMMVVNPAVTKQPVATPRISLTPKTNRQSLNFMSPAMVVIDRLLSLSNNTSILDQDVPIETNRNDANIILVQLRELLADKELHVHSLKCESRELKDRLSTLESKVKSLESEGEARLRKVNSLNEQLAEKEKSNKSMAAVVEQYEWTIANMISEMQQEKKRNAEERARLISERDEQTAHLASMERSFSDLHSKYEKCKQVILAMKANEDAYKKSLKDFDENLLKMQKNYDLLKQHATSKLNHANQELEKMNRAHEGEVVKLSAMIKRKEVHIHSLEESLAQKSKAIEELTSICDELINKVG